MKCIKNKRTRGEMDIIPVFGTVVGGSNPSECTREEATCVASVGDSKGFSMFC